MLQDVKLVIPYDEFLVLHHVLVEWEQRRSTAEADMYTYFELLMQENLRKLAVRRGAFVGVAEPAQTDAAARAHGGGWGEGAPVDQPRVEHARGRLWSRLCMRAGCPGGGAGSPQRRPPARAPAPAV